MLYEIDDIQGKTSCLEGLLCCRAEKWRWLTQGQGQGIERVWWTPGHLSLTTNRGHHLTTFDSRPHTAEVAIDDECLDVRDSPSRLVYLWHLTPHSVILLYDDGELTSFQFDTSSFTWQVLGSCLLTSTRGATVATACLHASAIYWTEWTKQDTEVCLCMKSLPAEGDSWKQSNFGMQTTIVKNCPQSDLYTTPECLIIWPRWHQGAAVYMKFFSVNGELQMAAPGCDNVSSVNTIGQAADFTVMLRDAATAWVEEEPISEWLTVRHSTNQNVFFITRDCCVKCVGKEMQHLTTLEQFDLQVADCVLHKHAIIAAYRNCIKIWHKDTGILRQVLQVADDICGLWIGGSTLQMTGFFTAHSIFYLKITTKKTTEISEDVKMFIKSPQAKTLSALENIYQNTKKSSKELQEEVKNIDLRSLQSPALLVALSQQPDLGNLKEVLKTLAKHHKGPDTAIMTELNPMLQLFGLLDSAGINNISNSIPVESKSQCDGLKAYISKLLDGEWQLSVPTRCSTLDLLAQQDARQMLGIIDAQLGLNNTHGLTNEQKKKWQFLLALNHGRESFEIFKTLCRIKYLKQPATLKNFIETATSIKEKQTGGASLLDRGHRERIIGHVIHTLPDASQSVDSNAAAAVLSWLINNSKERKSEALLNLISGRHWEIAVAMVTEMSCDQANAEYPQLYHILLTAMQKHGVFHSYQDSMLSIAPHAYRDSLLFKKPPEKAIPGTIKNIFARDTDIPIGGLQNIL